MSSSSLPWVRRIGAVVSLTLLGRLAGFLFPVIVLREMGHGMAGLTYFFINTAYFVVQPVSGGPSVVVVRPIAAASSDQERGQWLRAALAGMVPAVTLAAVIGVVVCVTASAPITPMLILVIGLSADAMYFALLTARHRYTAAATYRLVSNIGQLITLILLFALGGRAVTAVVAVFALSYVFGFAAIEPRERVVAELLRRGVAATREQLRSLLHKMVPTVGTGFAYACITGADTYLVRLHDAGLVAPYGAAKTLAAPFILVSLAVTTIAQPEAARATQEQAVNIRRQMLRLGALGGGICIVACWALAPIAIHLVYGGRYPQAVLTLRWLGTGTTLLGLHTLLQAWCWGRGAYVIPMKSLGSGAVVAVVTNILLVPHDGAAGAAVAFCVGSSVALALLVLMSAPSRIDPAAPRSGLPPLRAFTLRHVGATLSLVALALTFGYGATQIGSLPGWECSMLVVGLIAAFVCVRRGVTHPLGLFPLVFVVYFVFGAQNWVSRAGYITFRTYVPTNAVLRLPLLGIVAYGACALVVLWLWKRPQAAPSASRVELGPAYRRAAVILLTIGALGGMAAVAHHGLLVSNPAARAGGPGKLGTFAYALLPGGVLFALTARRRWLIVCSLLGTSLALLVTIGFRTAPAILILTCVICGGFLHRFRPRAVIGGLIAVVVLGVAINTYRLEVNGTASVFGTKIVATGPLAAFPGMLPLYYSTPHEGVAVFNTLEHLVPSVYAFTHGRMQLATYQTAIPHSGKRVDSRTVATQIVDGTAHPKTTLTPTILGGPYVDFGEAGVIVEMGILGLLMAALYRGSQAVCRSGRSLAYAYALALTLVGIHIGLLDVQFEVIVPLFTAVALWIGSRSARTVQARRLHDPTMVGAS